MWKACICRNINMIFFHSAQFCNVETNWYKHSFHWIDGIRICLERYIDNPVQLNYLRIKFYNKMFRDKGEL